MTLKRLLCAAFTLLTLTACGKQQFDPAQVAASYAAGVISAEYIVTTHAGFFTEYKLSSIVEGGSSRVTILEPKSVAGISAHLEGEQAMIQYDEVALDALLPEKSGYAPVDVLHMLLVDLKDALPESWGMENDRLVLEYSTIFEDNTRGLKRIFLHPETLDMQGAELYLEDSLILSVQLTQFSRTEG